MFSNNSKVVEQFSETYYKEHPEVKRVPKEPIPRRRFNRTKASNDLPKLETKN